jgi:hypothetical protein
MEHRHRPAARIAARTTLAAALVLAAGTAFAQTEPEWQAILRLQLAEEQKCELLRVVSMRQLPSPGLDALEGRIRCADGREYDFSREKAHQKFTIRLCQPAVC